jgi:hypothetical protein
VNLVKKDEEWEVLHDILSLIWKVNVYVKILSRTFVFTSI